MGKGAGQTSCSLKQGNRVRFSWVLLSVLAFAVASASGWEETDAWEYQVWEGRDNVAGLLGLHPSVHFLGAQADRAECEAAAMRKSRALQLQHKTQQGGAEGGEGGEEREEGERDDGRGEMEEEEGMVGGGEEGEGTLLGVFSYTWYTTSAGDAGLRGMCFGRTDKTWAPAHAPPDHVVSGRWRGLEEREGGEGAEGGGGRGEGRGGREERGDTEGAGRSDVEGDGECRAEGECERGQEEEEGGTHRDGMKEAQAVEEGGAEGGGGQSVIHRGGREREGEGEGEGEGGLPECRVLEWRLLGHYAWGNGRRQIMSMRSCSVCGVKGCNVCPPSQVCPGDAGGGQGAMRVTYSSDPALAHSAHVILVPATGDLARFELPVKKAAGQAWVALAGESAYWWPHVEDLQHDPRFDLVMGYSRHLADMHASYTPHDYHALRRPKAYSAEELAGVNRSAEVAFFASNCRSEFRQAWVGGFMEGMAVDSWGECYRNRRLPPSLDAEQQEGDVEHEHEEGPKAWRPAMAGQNEVKRKVLSLYRFALAVENTREEDYLTEKVFDVLEAGAVPIYLGAPNWRDFVPEGAVVDAGAFDSPHDVAEFVREVAQDEKRYAEFHRWREEALPSHLEAMAGTSFTHNLCRVCRWKAAWRKHSAKQNPAK